MEDYETNEKGYFPIYDENGNEYDDLVFKKCTKCRSVKEKTEFYTYTRSTDGLRCSCKMCHKRYKHGYNQRTETKEKNNKRKRGYYKQPEVREKTKKKSLDYYYKNREKMLKYARDNREHANELRRIRRAKKREITT